MTDNNNNLNTKSLNHRAPSSTGLSSLSTNSSSSSSALSNNSSPNTSSISASLVNKPSIIEYKHYRFLIMDAPTESNIFAYIEMLKKKGVVAVVRACEPTYNSDTLIKAGIKVMEAPFPDGDPPADSIIDQWLALVQKEFDENNNNNNKSSSNGNNNGNNNNNNNKDDNKDNKHTIAVHCVAGLGRAPILVAIALMEAGMAPLDVIDFVRKRRRGAFNSKQLKYIQAYKPRKEKKNDCLIM